MHEKGKMQKVLPQHEANRDWQEYGR